MTFDVVNNIYTMLLVSIAQLYYVMYVGVCMCVQIETDIHTETDAHIYMYTHVLVRTHARTHRHTHRISVTYYWFSSCVSFHFNNS